MQANSTEYRRRLMRMRTLGDDFRLACGGPGSSATAAAAARRRPSSVSASAAVKEVSAGPGDDSGRIIVVGASDKGITQSSTSGKGNTGGSLWMRQPQRRQPHHHRRQTRPPQPLPEPQPHQVARHHSPDSAASFSSSSLETQTLMDMQTNNSKRQPWVSAGDFGRRGGVTAAFNNANSAQPASYQMELADAAVSDDSEPEFQNSNAASDDDDLSNENAVAKGANALVKQATSRQTEIIDTSKLLEEGKVETAYEEPEDEPEEIEVTDTKLIDEYEKTFAYARRLRALLNMQFKVMDKNSIETNFLLVKAHEHPTQKVVDRWRNVDLGDPYDSQIRKNRLVDDFKQTCGQKKKPKKGQVIVPIFPDWIKFCFRFRKDASEKRWADFTAYKQRMKKLSGGKVAVPKANDRYLPAFYDVWSTSIVVFAKPSTTLLNMVDPVFAKLGLDARADFKFTVGAFEGDKRAGKAKVQGAPSVPEEITMQTLCGDLYKRNCSEIFVNDNRIAMFQAFPGFFSSGDAKKKDADDGAGKDGGKGKKDKKKGGKNQSNLESAADAAAASSPSGQMAAASAVLARSQRRLQQLQQQRSGDESRQGDTTATAPTATAATAATAKASIAAEAEAAAPAHFDSSPSATNRNLSVHDCESSEHSQPTREAANSTTKSGRSETTRRE